jgi:hypothetical protein
MCSSKLYAALVAAIALATAAGCNDTTCGSGTADKNGTCVPADETVGTAQCGSDTVLEGDQCVPAYPPTQCDPTTTTAMTDPVTGVVTCVGNGGGGCNATFACPDPDSGKQTICGQIYDFEDNSKFQEANPVGTQCGSDTTSAAPCALQILAFDAVAFGNDPTGTAPLPTDPVYIDDCGRFRVENIDLTGVGPFVALGIDDAGQPLGPTGVTVTTGVALPQEPSTATPSFEGFIVDEATVGEWQTTGGPMLSDGIYVGIFRAHVCMSFDTMCTGDVFADQGGVTFTKSGSTEPDDDYYFLAETTHDHIDPTATATSINGTGLLTMASVNDELVYSGTGGITDTTNCKWETHAAASLSGIVFFQVYRPTNSSFNTTCTQ